MINQRACNTTRLPTPTLLRLFSSIIVLCWSVGCSGNHRLYEGHSKPPTEIAKIRGQHPLYLVSVDRKLGPNWQNAYIPLAYNSTDKGMFCVEVTEGVHELSFAYCVGKGESVYFSKKNIHYQIYAEAGFVYDFRAEPTDNMDRWSVSYDSSDHESQTHVAEQYRVQGKYAEAERICTQLLASVEEARGPDHSDVGACLGRLAIVYHHQRKYDQAEPLFQRALRIAKNTWGSNHLETAKCMGNLAVLYSDWGKYEQAESLFKQTLKTAKDAQEANHPSLIACMSSFADMYLAKGMHDEAESLIKKSLTIAKRAYGADHLDVAACSVRLAMLYQAQGKFDRAEPLCEKALAIAEKLRGQEHPDVGAYLNISADLQLARGNLDKAESLLKRSLTIAPESVT